MGIWERAKERLRSQMGIWERAKRARGGNMGIWERAKRARGGNLGIWERARSGGLGTSKKHFGCSRRVSRCGCDQVSSFQSSVLSDPGQICVHQVLCASMREAPHQKQNAMKLSGHYPDR